MPKYRALYRQTLFNGSRQPYGRVPGQDYTECDGKQITPHRKKQKKTYKYWKSREQRWVCPIETPFCTDEDLIWLELETIRREYKKTFDEETLGKLIGSLFALIPIFGVPAMICIYMGGPPAPVLDFDGEARALHFHIINCKNILLNRSMNIKLSNSPIARRFIDYRKSIANKRTLLQETSSGGNRPHFITANLHSLYADPHITREELKSLSRIIDETFDWDDTSATFGLYSENQPLALDMLLSVNCELNQEECQEFINRVSEQVFQGKPISFEVIDEFNSSSRNEHYESIRR